MHRFIRPRPLFATGFVAFAAVAGCQREQDAPPTLTTYQNGYPQSQPQAQPQGVTYQNGYPQNGYPQQQPVATTAPTVATVAPIATIAPAVTATPTVPQPGIATMAVPGFGALVCQNDSQCILGRCNAPYGHCAFPCKNSALDCASNAVCSPVGLCVLGQQSQPPAQSRPGAISM